MELFMLLRFQFLGKKLINDSKTLAYFDVILQFKRSINNFNAHFGEVSTMFPQMSQVPQQVAAPELVSAFRQQQEQIRELQSQINQGNYKI